MEEDTNLQVEYGCGYNVRFLPPLSVKIYDADGNVINCRCGKPAVSAAMGKEAFVAWCEDCSPMNKPSAELVYRPPSDEQKKKLKEMGFKILENSSENRSEKMISCEENLKRFFDMFSEK